MSLSADQTQSQAPPESALVVGAGLAGLAAADRLAERGVRRVIIVEQSPSPGGLAATLRFGKVSADIGPHRIHSEIPEIEKYLEEIAGESLFSVKRQSRMRLGGQFLNYPPGAMQALRGLGLPRLGRCGLSWLGARLGSLTGGRDIATFDGQMRAAFGSGLYEFLVEPFARKVWKTDPRQLDAEAARVRVSAGSLGKMVRRALRPREKKGGETSLRSFNYTKGGAGTLADRLAQRLERRGVEIHYNARAKALRLEEGRIKAIEVETPDGPREFQAQRFISTSPLGALVEALSAAETLDEGALQAAHSLRRLDMILIYLVIARESIGGDHWIYFPESRFPFNRASEAKAFDPSMAPPGQSVLCVEITCRPDQDLWGETDQSLAQRVAKDLAQTGLFAPNEILERHVHRQRHVYPIYDLGYRQRVQTILAELSRFENLVTTGRQGLFNFNNMDHSIYMGHRAADCAIDSPCPGRDWPAMTEDFRKFRIVD